MKTSTIPYPLFDNLEIIEQLYKSCQTADAHSILNNYLKQACQAKKGLILAETACKDYLFAMLFLYSYRGSPDTFNSYRREIERFIQWLWFIQKKSLSEAKRLDIEAFIEFCRQPPKSWIGIKTVARFINHNGQRISNTMWRPFVVKISKKAFQDGQQPEKNDFELSQQAMRAIFAVLSSFYQFLIQEDAAQINPVLQIRQKSKFIRTAQADSKVIRRLSELQWQTVIQTTRLLADKQPLQHERSLFIMSALYGMYLRISELAASERWVPQMNHFFRDNHNHWWFKTVGKGNKLRQIAVSEAMLAALTRWRKFLGLRSLPSIDEQTVLIPKQKGKGAIESTRMLRNIVQICFDAAIATLQKNDETEEADLLRSATVHWLRHTGISDDVLIRPREHVRDDAGHSSGAITDRYIDVELQARAKSAKNKLIDE